jgi:transposase InsO family protein
MPPAPPSEATKEARAVQAKHPNDVWHIDLTTVPIASGFWTTWLPNALPQRWPYCWWVAVVVDQFSRRVMGTATFHGQPTSEEVRAFLGRAIHQVGTAPKHLICDRGPQFNCHGFRSWAGKRKIQVRYGAVGKHSSIAVVERFIRTLKEILRALLDSAAREAFRK